MCALNEDSQGVLESVIEGFDEDGWADLLPRDVNLGTPRSPR